MHDNDIIIGIEINDSTSRVLVTTAAGEELADVTGAGVTLELNQEGAAAAAIATLAASALESAEQTQYRPKLLSVSASYTRRDAEYTALQRELLARELADDVIVHDDAQAAITDAFGDESGIVLLAGNSVHAYGRSPAGITRRSGGWGTVIGGEGSALWIGQRALSVVVSAQDGREPETALTGAILTAAQVNDAEELIAWAATASPGAIAALAPSVIAAAMQGDLRANAIADMAAEELMLHVRALAKHLFIDERAAFSVALGGSLLEKGALLRKRLERRLKYAVPGATVRAGDISSVRGALKIAQQIGAHS